MKIMTDFHRPMFLGMVSMIQIRATGSPNEHATDATDPERG